MNQTISDLVSRGFGGGDAVVVPGSDVRDNLPSSAPPAGVNFAVSRLIDAANNAQADANCWVVLIGGPGNGKSFQVERVIRELDLDPLLDQEGLAKRSRWTDIGQSKVLVVNDATIRDSHASTGEPGDLSQEIRLLRASARRQMTHALISVNRGILIEEKARIPRKAEWDAERQLISWLMGHDHDAEELKDGEVTSAYYRSTQITQTGSRAPIKIHAVYLDQLSLFEAQPNVDESTSGSPPQYETMRPKVDSRDETPAARLLQKLCEPSYFEEAGCDGCAIQPSCPLFANVQALRDKRVRLGFLDVARYAEIVSGHLFTYRDLWALLAVAIAGTPDIDVEGQHKCEWVKDLVSKLDENGADADDAAYELLRQRYYEALFEGARPFGGDASGNRSVETSPAMRRIRQVDPVIDANRAWAEPVLDSVQSIAYGESPLESAKAESETLAAGTAEIDLKVEQRFLSKITGEQERVDDIRRRVILRWRGHTLYRHYAITNGISAYHEEVEEWLKLRRLVGEKFTEIPSDSHINSALRYMLLPPARFHGNELCLLPLFEPRVLPITGPQNTPVWCYGVPRVDEFSWKIRAIGDSMQVLLSRIGGGEVARFELDFNITREALACRVYEGERNHCDYGFTEQGDAVSPRLERIRASFLSSKQRNDSALARIAHTDLATIRLEPPNPGDRER